MRYGVRRQAWRWMLAASVAAPLAGCLVIPTDYTAPVSRHNVTADTAAQLQPGVTTKEAVLLQFGEPDVASSDERRLGYRWTQVRAIWIIVGYGSAAGGAIGKTSLLELSFDEHDVLVGTRIVAQWVGDAL